MNQQAAPHPNRVGDFFQHTPIQRLIELRQRRPVQTEDMRVGFNGRVGLFITTVVGTMWAAYLFTVTGAIGIAGALTNSTFLVLLIGAISGYFLQLVLLPIIIVGQNIQGAAADKRAISTYHDAEAILQQCVELQQHLAAQDKVLDDVLSHLHDLGLAPQQS